MDVQLLVICLLTAGIHLIGTLAYGARIAGVRTRRIAMSFALFNVLVLVSRMSNSFLGPFLAKRIEVRLAEAPPPPEEPRELPPLEPVEIPDAPIHKVD